MPGETPEPVGIAILAKAPLPGLVKTRLIRRIGPQGAARLQRALVARTVETACQAGTGPVTLWTGLDPDHEIFTTLAARFDVRLARQSDGDLGARMLAAIAGGPTLVIGNDCPALTPHHLREAAAALRDGNDAVIIPAEDGGYVLIGLRQPQPALFRAMRWSVPTVMAETRRRLAQHGLRALELAGLWDVDVPEDLDRLLQPGFEDLVDAFGPHLVKTLVAANVIEPRLPLESHGYLGGTRESRNAPHRAADALDPELEIFTVR